jgi:hypothetical protein
LPNDEAQRNSRINVDSAFAWLLTMIVTVPCWCLALGGFNDELFFPAWLGTAMSVVMGYLSLRHIPGKDLVRVVPAARIAQALHWLRM